MNQTSWYCEQIEEVFKFITKTGFITKPLLSDLFNVTNKRTLNRLIYAVNHSKLFFPHLKTLGFHSWRLSRAGKYRAADWGLKPSFPHRISTAFHDEMTLSIAIRCERLGLISHWEPEAKFIVNPMNSIAVTSDKRGQKYPDLVVGLPSTEMNLVAIELELSRKSMGRYIKALNGYKAVRGIDAIIFAVGFPAIRKTIEVAIRNTRFERIPIVFVDAAAFKENPSSASLECAGWQGSLQTLSSIKRGHNAA